MSWSRSARTSAVTLAALVWLCRPAPAQVFTDNFNSGTDTGWFHLQPLNNGTWSFPGGNSYRVQAANTGSTGNPGRAASLRTELTYTDFYVAADVVNWDNTLNQLFGLGARVTNPGLGTSNGYLLVYSNLGASLGILRVTNETLATVSTTGLTLDPTHDYRFVFAGTGANLSANVFDLANPGTPLLATPLSGTDTTWPSGSPGLLVLGNVAGTASAADATFDNFFVGPTAPVPEPATWVLMLMAATGAWTRRRFRR